jgi:DNA-directed RNA polymerase subunit H (RpoH/RPB5)
VERWGKFDALLKEAEAAEYPSAVSVLTKRISCLLPPTARQEKARVDELPDQFLLNPSGTRACAIYQDRLEIRDAQTYKVINTFKFPRTPAGCESIFAFADHLNDRVFYAVDYVIRKCTHQGFPRHYFVQSFDEFPPRRIEVSEQFEGWMPSDMIEQGIRLRLKLLAKLTSPEAGLRERPEATEQLKVRLRLGKLSGVVRVDFDPATELGMYRVYALDRLPGPKEAFLIATESVVLYDGGSRLITLIDRVQSKVGVQVFNSSKLGFAITDYHTSLDVRHQQAIVGNKLFRFSDTGVSEVINLDLALDEIKHLEITPDGEGVLVEFHETLDESDGEKSIGLYNIKNKNLHKISAFDVIARQFLLPATKQVWILTNDKRLETWDVSVFQSNGWASDACPAQ